MNGKGRYMDKVQIDIVSDVVCPWCIIGYKRLALALIALSDHLEADIHWHPFELNPAMPTQGQNLSDHLIEKFGTSAEACLSAKHTLSALGHQVGFQFHYSEDTKIYNTRKAHQLLMWSQVEDRQLDLVMEIFRAYFTQGQDISSDEVLMNCAEHAGLNMDTAAKVLNDDSWATAVASTEQQWIEAGISAVPAIIINKKHIFSGAQPTEVLINKIDQLAHSN